MVDVSQTCHGILYFGCVYVVQGLSSCLSHEWHLATACNCNKLEVSSVSCVQICFAKKSCVDLWYVNSSQQHPIWSRPYKIFYQNQPYDNPDSFPTLWTDYLKVYIYIFTMPYTTHVVNKNKFKGCYWLVYCTTEGLQVVSHMPNFIGNRAQSQVTATNPGNIEGKQNLHSYIKKF